jgi:hypothetical protein
MAEAEQATRSTGGGDRGQADAEPQPQGDEGRPEQRTTSSGKPMGRAPSSEPDVHLDVPRLHVGEIGIDVDRLEAHVALRAQLANVLNLVAGAHVGVDRVRIEIKDVDAEAMLKVRLDNTYNILDRTLTTLDENPQLVDQLSKAPDVDRADDLGSEADERGGAVSELASGVGDAVGSLGGTLGDKLSSVTEKSSPRRLLGRGQRQPEAESDGSSDESDASGGGSRLAKGAAAAGAAGAVGLAGAALLRSRPRRRILGIPIGRKKGLTALVEQIAKASDQATGAGDTIEKVQKASETVDNLRKTARKALP